MVNHSIKCEAINVRSESGVCPGMAKTQKNEKHTFGARSPEKKEFVRQPSMPCSRWRIQCC